MQAGSGGRPGGSGRSGRFYDRSKKEKAAVRASIASQLPADYEPFTCDVKVQLDCVFPRPASHYHKRSGKKTLKPDARSSPFRPDVDNAAKLVLDACNRLVYTDDAQVARLEGGKRDVREEAGPGEEVGTYMTVQRKT